MTLNVHVWQLLGNLVGFVALAIAGYYIVRSKVAATNQALAEKNLGELQRLVDIRGDHIEDLESSVIRLSTEIRELQTTVANLRGQMTAIQGIKAQEIAVEVARLLAIRTP